ncbi:uncharacterized protein LOC111609627 isoform X3 [Xiphophorus maculatus]|uniref:uncharacterized protein LOC111609627 isoform X3 n=1 Tax=Xiphophorus maculatus TaxID=8083 RepID=UPI000C6D9012|nr:uncharacterized protein LOC111609627 isoform X3 [Xiphophorus maculatus]
MSIIKPDILALHFIFNQQEISVLDQRGSKSPKPKRAEEEEPEVIQVKEEEYESEPQQFVKKEEMETSIETDSGSLEIKGEPVELRLKQMKEDDRLSKSQQMVKVEVEDISLDRNQDKLQQETDTVKGTDSKSPELKEEPAELEPNQVKADDHGSGPELMGEKEAEGISQDENQDVLEQNVDTVILKFSDDETDHHQPEISENKILIQNLPKAKYQNIKTHKASDSSRDDQQQKRAQKNRGQSDDVERGMKGRKIHKASFQ